VLTVPWEKEAKTCATLIVVNFAHVMLKRIELKGAVKNDDPSLPNA
jgi:hypothetical protein